MIPDLDILLKGLLPAMDENADFLRESRRNFKPDDVEYKSSNDLVSFVDRESEEHLRKACSALLPESGFILEEGGSDGADREYRWIIDPLDGTTNFVHDLPAWCMSVALQKDEETVLGVVYDVPHREVFTAILGQGAFRNGQPIQVSSQDKIEKSLIGMGFPYHAYGRMDDYLSVVKALLLTSCGVRRFGAAALDLCQVACGRLDGFFEMGLQAWDVAAGALILAESGGKASDFRGTANFVFGKQIVASNGKLQEEMLDAIRKRF
jgi:myo-inositol-1(or 4)-monophosphatase